MCSQMYVMHFLICMWLSLFSFLLQLIFVSGVYGKCTNINEIAQILSNLVLSNMQKIMHLLQDYVVEINYLTIYQDFCCQNKQLKVVIVCRGISLLDVERTWVCHTLSDCGLCKY